MVVTEIAEQIRMDLERCYPEGCEGKNISPQSIGLFDSNIDSQNLPQQSTHHRLSTSAL